MNANGKQIKLSTNSSDNNDNYAAHLSSVPTLNYSVEETPASFQLQHSSFQT